ncbi:porin family protein [Thiohalocapsa marina]|uniref:Porin family protein n=1 Tax=Thiohalocapsa marina TaxID=424902 RepID=A0A5M8FVA6_9GAMM|nr:outer membrane beta-barrel protein [Thiohalocapsa marina]KAA6187758.1 porin family protein [Thiohalocapsa marina]
MTSICKRFSATTVRALSPSSPLSLLFALSVSLVAPAEAADWYLRGALGYEQSRDANFSDRDCASQQPAALFGCVRGDDGRPIGAYGDFGDYPMAELAVGRRLLPWLRADLSVGYRFASEYAGNANFLSVGTHEPVSADFESWLGLANVFVDLAALNGADLGRFQPYVGIGAGVAHNRLGEMTYRFPENPGRHKISVTPDGDRTNFAYQVTLGTGIALSDTLTLDLSGYYVDLGEVGTDSGIMSLNTLSAGIPIDETSTNLRAFGVAVGLRRAF